MLPEPGSSDVAAGIVLGTPPVPVRLTLGHDGAEVGVPASDELVGHTCPPPTLTGTLPSGYSGFSASGEHLESLDVETPEWRLVTGGYDEDVIAQLVGSDFPASWAGQVHPESWYGPYGAHVADDGTSIAWVFPQLSSGDHVDVHVAIAWRYPTSPGEPESAWIAVDTTPERLLRAAGIPPAVGGA